MVQVDWLDLATHISLEVSQTATFHTYDACMCPLSLALLFVGGQHACTRSNYTHVIHYCTCRHVIQVILAHGAIQQGPIQLPNTVEPCALHAMTCRACVHITHATSLLCGGQPRLCRCNPCTHSISVSRISIRVKVSTR